MMNEFENICKLFGHQSDKVRKLFGSTQQQNGLKIVYPKPNKKMNQNAPPNEAHNTEVFTPVIHYPIRRIRLNKPLKSRPIRKSLSAIEKELANIPTTQCAFFKPDLSHEKTRLQEVFQFSYTTVLPPAAVLPKI